MHLIAFNLSVALVSNPKQKAYDYSVINAYVCLLL